MKQDIKESVRKLLLETSLGRIYQHMLKFETGIITAHRKNNTPEINQANNKELKAVLLKGGYGVTNVSGDYIEDYNTDIAKVVKEHSYFVVNLKNDSNFIKTIAELGNKYNQDSIIIIEIGCEKSYLLGTNDAEFPGLNNSIPLGKFKPKNTGEFMTTVKNAPFTLGEGLETYKDLSRLGKMAVTAIVNNQLIK